MRLWTYLTKYQTMFWDWSWSWHFLVVHNKCFSNREMVPYCHFLRINIHEIIHVNLKSAVMIKPLLLFIFTHNFWSFCLCFFLFIIFCCFAYNNLQHILPPISYDVFFSFNFVLSTHLLRLQPSHPELSLPWIHLRNFFPSFPIRDIRFSSNVKMSSFH